MLKKVKYCLSTSLRRKKLDKLMKENTHYFKESDVVLDIGGRDRGMFRKPKELVGKWIFADIEEKHNPDIVVDVCNMDNIESNSIDIVLASELFEHVNNPEKGLAEVKRVLKEGGSLIMSVPFLYPIHGDPFDYQRYTLDKWKMIFKDLNLEIKKEEVMGRYFSVIAEGKKFFFMSLPKTLRILLTPLVVINELMAKFDNLKCAKNNKALKGFHGGYFFVLKK